MSYSGPPSFFFTYWILASQKSRIPFHVIKKKKTKQTNRAVNVLCESSDMSFNMDGEYPLLKSFSVLAVKVIVRNCGCL